VGHDSRPTFSFYLQSYSSLSIITAQFRYFFIGLHAIRTVASMRLDCLVKLASRGLKSERRIPSGRAVHLLFFAIQALHAFVRFSQFALFSHRRKALFFLSLSLFLSRLSYAGAKAISGDSWEDYCGAARRERRSRPPKST